MATREEMRTLPQQLLQTLQQSGMWESGQRVTIAVSGGLDSICLLHLLAMTADAHGGSLQVVTINHGLRDESLEEVEFVAQQSKELGLVCHIRHLSISKGANLQARAREQRRKVLLSIPADRIVTAHHQNDQAALQIPQLDAQS